MVAVDNFLFFVTFFTANFPTFVFGIRYIDLTYSVGFDTPLWPTHRKFDRQDELEVSTHPEDEENWIASQSFTMSEHMSTHIDAPYHVFQGMWKLTDIPLERLMNVPGIMIDMSWKITKTTPVKRNYVVGKEDIVAWDQKNGKIPSGVVVFVRTGWGDKFLTDGRDYIGQDPKCCSFPGLGLPAAKLFVERGVYGVGIDTVSLDVGFTEVFPFHTYMGSRNKFMIENVANLHLLPAKGFNVFLFPLKLEGGTGSPIRIFATLK